MKKMILAAVLAMMCAGGMNAQDSSNLEHRLDSLETALNQLNNKVETDKLNNKIWGKGRFFRLGYSWSQTADESSPVEKSKYSFFLTKGTTYRIPSNPIAGMLKFGIDAVWFDAQFSKYNSPYDNMIWTSEIEPVGGDDDDDEAFNIGTTGIGIGMGIGPSVSVAPFAKTNIKGLRMLRASLYFHYAPTFQMYLASQDGNTEMSTAFCNMMNFGGTLTFRAISLGVEGRWGKGKFKPLFNLDDEGGSSKYTRKFANTRLYIQFAF